MTKRNPPRRFYVTYEIVMPASSERGRMVECGFINRDGLHVPFGKHDAIFGDVALSLGEAFRFVSPDTDAGGWWVELGGQIDVRTGAFETRAIHPPPNVTPSTYARLSRILLGRR